MRSIKRVAGFIGAASAAVVFAGFIGIPAAPAFASSQGIGPARCSWHGIEPAQCPSQEIGPARCSWHGIEPAQCPSQGIGAALRDTLTTLIDLNPQPLPPGIVDSIRIELNPQPLPPRVFLNPQPLPPRLFRDLLDLNPQPLPPGIVATFSDLVALNPQPLPPGVVDVLSRLVDLNPQPLPPGYRDEVVDLNPQPLPPGIVDFLKFVVALNPQPLPPGVNYLNPQPLPPGVQHTIRGLIALNPQPLPPGLEAAFADTLAPKPLPPDVVKALYGGHLPALTITTTSVPAAEASVPYGPVTLAASGGEPPYAWSVAGGSLPPGLTLGASSGVISGTPTTNGTYDFTIGVTDSESPTVTATHAFSILVTSPLTITTTSVPAAEASAPYGPVTLAASGGEPPYAWSLAGGSLPPGLTLGAGSGVISGTPSTNGTYDFTIGVTDSESPTVTATQAFSILVTSPLSPLTITTTSVPAAESSAPYGPVTLAASGGEPPYAWSLAGGSLPPGLTLGASSGVISGTPTINGTYHFTIGVTDSESPTVTATQAFSVLVFAPLTITTNGLPEAETNVPYTDGVEPTPGPVTLAASGGKPPYAWSVAGGSLPPGLTLGASSGVISGTPTTNGTYDFTIGVTDSLSQPVTRTEALSILVFSAI